MGFYYPQLKRYYERFDAAQLRVVVYDDFVARAGEVVRDLYRFLDVDDRFEPDTSQRLNVSMVPSHPTYHALVVGQNPLKAIGKAILPVEFRQRVKERLVDRNLTKPAPLNPEVRRQLMDVFRPDILRLQELIDRDLSLWL